MQILGHTLYLTVLAIVVVPVTMTCWKIVQYNRVSKNQVFDLHHHIVHTLAVNTTAYFNQLNMRLAFAPLLARGRQWAEHLEILNNALMSLIGFFNLRLIFSFYTY